MKERFFSLFGGFILTLGIIILVVFLFSRPASKIEVETTDPADPAKLESIGETTKGLNNYGDLPKQVQNPDVGRSNPFDNY